MPIGTMTAMLALTAASAASSAVGQVAQGNAARRQGDYEANLANMNATIAGLQADDAMARGREGASRVRTQTRQLVGEQRTAAAASGIDTTVGSPAALVRDTNYLGELDARTVMLNAQREAWGYKVEAANATASGVMARRAGRNAQTAGFIGAGSTLLTGGAQILGMRRASK